MDGRWDKFSNGLAVALIGAAMVAASWNVLSREVEEWDPDTMVIRVSHTLLDVGLREALDAVAAKYERIQAERGREVDIRFIDVPEQAYAQWARTQLIGGTAPQVIFTGHSNGFDTFLTSRYLVPISEEVEKPNPYNEGASQEGVPWRFTFFDGMNVSGYNFRLSEHFGVPLSATTTRAFINRDLLEKVLDHPANRELRERLGPDLEQATADDLFAICEATEAYASETGRSLAPIAGSRENARQLMSFLFSSVTQKAKLLWDKDYDYAQLSGIWTLDQFRRSELSYDNPAFRRGFSILREVAQYMQPGFFQMRRQDATFYFAQENALMTTASSWDAASFRALIGDRFEMLVLPIPAPSKEHPYYGKYVLGAISEGNVTPAGTFSFVNYHPEEELEVALDFMRFATSAPGNRLFTRLSGWLPSVFGVEPSEENKPFMPRLEGFPSGPDYDFVSTDMQRAVETRFHLLFGRDGGLEPFLESLLPEVEDLYWKLAVEDIEDRRKSLQQQDTMLGAALWRHLKGLEGGERKTAEMIDSMIRFETHVLRNEKLLRQSESGDPEIAARSAELTRKHRRRLAQIIEMVERGEGGSR